MAQFLPLLPVVQETSTLSLPYLRHNSTLEGAEWAGEVIHRPDLTPDRKASDGQRAG